jgi:hypothetical protein
VHILAILQPEAARKAEIAGPPSSFQKLFMDLDSDVDAYSDVADGGTVALVIINTCSHEMGVDWRELL